jgi:selenocysteine-specific elongation factor
MVAEPRVIATAGHVDHGKSSLIVQLTGIDPDRFAEEKRRGLTIDLGYAWTTLPSGREVGFVDVPGHERFIANMLAGVGPVRLVLFVVAADEGWKPQSEEHLEILDVLGTTGGVVALTKRDLVDTETLGFAEEEIRERLEGTALAGATIVPVSSRTGEGLDELRGALDAMLAAAPAPEPARPRLFIDRVFTIKGAGTVVTGTLAGDCLESGDEVTIYPEGDRARIRSLQTHKEEEARACPVTRVAVNLVGAERASLGRGTVLGRPGTWRPTDTFEAVLQPVRGLGHAITARGAFKLYAGAAEADAKLRIYGGGQLEPDGRAFVRIRLTRPLVLDVFDRFVVREAGRRETLAGGTVLDVAPPRRAGADVAERLERRAAANRAELPALLADERGAVLAVEAAQLTGAEPGGPRLGDWLVRPDVAAEAMDRLDDALRNYHEQHPLEEGAPLAEVRRSVSAALRKVGAPTDPGLVEAVIGHAADRGDVIRTATVVRLSTHHVALDTRGHELDRLVSAIGGEREATPPTVKELEADGFDREVIAAAARAGVVIRVSPDLVLSPPFVERAKAVIQAGGGGGVTISAFREALGTSRKFAVPLMEWFDANGITRREGDLRFPRDP